MPTTLLKQMIGMLFLLTGGISNLYADLAPDFTLPRIDSTQTLTLSSLRGKVVYVDFWASWCTTCVVSLPALQSLQDDLHTEEFEIVAINLDDSVAQAEKFLSRFNISYAVVFDAERNTPQAFQITGMPTAFLIDRTGSIRSTHTGFNPDDKQKLEFQIKQLLKETAR